METKPVAFTWGVKIPLRDGVHLNATLYRPKASPAPAPEPIPAIFTLTPYIADSYHARAQYFAQHGYAFLLVDCRGRGNSEGTFEPFVNEGRDGYDVVEWLASQPWCSGKVTMWGGSYGGFDQWATLKHFPPHLKTIVPVASAHAAVDFPFFKNIHFPYSIQWLTYTSGTTGNPNLFGEFAFWREKFAELYLAHRPFKELDQVVGNLSTHFQTWMQHATPDEYWDQMALTAEEYDRIDVPVLSITGHYDGDQPGALHYYRQHMASASPARLDHFLIIGPWDHPGTRTPAKEFGGLKVGDASLVDMNKLHKEWYDWTMQGGPRPEFLKQRIAYYLMGAEEWKYAGSLESISNDTLSLYLSSQNGQAGDVYHSGVLGQQPAGDSLPDTYVYDPLDTRPEQLEGKEVQDWATSQHLALNLMGNGLVYHTAPFETETEITGCLQLDLWISLDAPDTDFLVVVSEVMADGQTQTLSADQMRARYRESLRVEQLVQPGEILCYHFDGFTFFSRQVAKGSRLRLVITSPNSIYAQKNYNSGGVVVEESGKEARTAHVTIYHDPGHPSCLKLPVVRSTDPEP